MRSIALKLSGPMQSWGTDSHFNIRHTDYYPSKSALIGLVAAALGIKRNDDKISSLNSIHFCVRIDQAGVLSNDYQTAHKSKGKKDDVYVTTRYYLSDAVFSVVLGIDDYSMAEKVFTGLCNPYYQLYMGRRAFPVPDDFILGIYDCDSLELIKKLPWQAADWYKRKRHEEKICLPVYTDDIKTIGIDKMRRDHVISLSSDGRIYSERIERKTSVYVLNERYQAHDAFGALGGL